MDLCDTLTLNFVLKTGVDALIALGVRSHVREAKLTRAVQAKYIDQAEEMGRDAFRLNRKDRDGNPLPDSGRLMFGHEYAPGDAFTFGRLIEDFKAAGFHLVDVNILREQHRDRMFVNFKREGDEPQLQRTAALAIDMIIEDTWWSSLQGFRNPDGRWNLNIKGRISQNEVKTANDQRIVKMGKDGVFGLVKVRQPATAPVVTTQPAQAVSA